MPAEDEGDRKAERCSSGGGEGSRGRHATAHCAQLRRQALQQAMKGGPRRLSVGTPSEPAIRAQTPPRSARSASSVECAANSVRARRRVRTAAFASFRQQPAARRARCPDREQSGELPRSPAEGNSSRGSRRMPRAEVFPRRHAHTKVVPSPACPDAGSRRRPARARAVRTVFACRRQNATRR